MSLFNTLHDFCLEQGFDQTYWVAYSGGLDSHVLLHLLVNLRSLYPVKLRAVHINHSLSPNAENWSTHCAAVCRELQVDYEQQTIDAIASLGESPEAVARQRRYAVFSELLLPKDLLLTAHHQDDQAETVLLQLLRGAGPKGLAAMPRIKPFGHGLQARPLLDFMRVDLKTYAVENQLSWIEDESNDNTDFSRNFIRHQVLPILKERWPSVATTLARVSNNCAEAQQLIDEVSMQDLVITSGSVVGTLSVSRLLKLNPMRQRQVLRLWLKRLGFPVPGMIKIQQVQRDILQARPDKVPHIAWKGVELRRYRDDVYAMPSLHGHNAEQVVSWDLQRPLDLPGVGVLCAVPEMGKGLCADLKEITVRFRRGGEVCRLPGRDCSHSLKKLFQEWHIPPWKRDRVPLIYVGDRLAAVAGVFIGNDFMAREGQEGYLLLLDETK